MKNSKSQTKEKENSNKNAKNLLSLWQRLLLIFIPLALTIGGVAVLYSLLAREKKHLQVLPYNNYHYLLN